MTQNGMQKGIKLFQYVEFDVKSIQVHLKSMTACIELVREISVQMLGNHRFKKEK